MAWYVKTKKTTTEKMLLFRNRTKDSFLVKNVTKVRLYRQTDRREFKRLSLDVENERINLKCKQRTVESTSILPRPLSPPVPSFLSFSVGETYCCQVLYLASYYLKKKRTKDRRK